MSDQPCHLCDGAAKVKPVYGPSGGARAATLTECPACSPWTISHQDAPLLEKETPETKRRISGETRKHFAATGEPMLVNYGLMLHCRLER